MRINLLPLVHLDRQLVLHFRVSAIGIFVAVSAGAIFFLVSDRQERLELARQDANLLALVVVEHTTQIFEKLKVLSTLIAEELQHKPGEPLSPILAQRTSVEAAVKSIAIFDQHGRILSSSHRLAAIDSQIAREIIDFFRRNPDETVHLSRSYRFRKAGWRVSFGRRIAGSLSPGPEIIVIGVALPMLRGFAARNDMPVGLVGEDGTILAADPEELTGRNIGSDIRHETGKAAGFRIDSGLLSPGKHLYAYVKSQSAPLSAYVGVPLEPIHAGWLLTVQVVTLGLIGIGGTLAGMGAVLKRYFNSRRELTDSLLENARERQERLFLESILATGGALVAVLDRNGCIVMANPAFHALFDEALPLGDNWMCRMFAMDPEALLQALPCEKTASVQDKYNRRRELAWTITPLRDHDNTVRHVVAIGFDNTERREAELSIYQAGKLVTLGEMSTGLAHEINQPIATIGLTVDVLRDRLAAGTAEPRFIADKLENISRQVCRTSRIVDHMRVFGRRSEGASYAFDPMAAVDGVLIIAEKQLSEASIQIRKQCAPQCPMVMGDIVQLEQILLNLILNARDAILAHRAANGKPRGDWVDIRVGAAVTEKLMAITVADSGGGIPPHIIDRIFDPFFTTKPIGKGTGLGLALSYGIAKTLGGRIEVENTKAGAAFTVWLLRADRARPPSGPDAGVQGPSKLQQGGEHYAAGT